MDFRSRLHRLLYCSVAVASLCLSGCDSNLILHPEKRKPAPTPTPAATPKATPTPKPSPTPTPKPAATPAPAKPTGLIRVEPKALIATFSSYVGMRETPKNSNRGELIDAANKATGVPMGSAWCASITHYGYRMNGAPDRPGAWSPSWYRKTRRIPDAQAMPGDVGLVWSAKAGRYNHTIAAIEKVNRSGKVISFTTLEGNTNAGGSREGDGFYRRNRAAGSIVIVRWWTPE